MSEHTMPFLSANVCVTLRYPVTSYNAPKYNYTKNSTVIPIIFGK